jgi:hypothetical protein
MRRTVKEFKADVAKLVREQYANATLSWKHEPRHVKGAGYKGLAMVVAGLKTTFLLAEGDDAHTWVH